MDADTLKERYCVEAAQWQQALQNARRVRGDRGPLSRFSIELLDDGYRAIDPMAKLRYLVSKAPGDAPLTAAGGNAQAAAKPAAPAAAPQPVVGSDGAAAPVAAPVGGANASQPPAVVAPIAASPGGAAALGGATSLGGATRISTAPPNAAVSSAPASVPRRTSAFPKRPSGIPLPAPPADDVEIAPAPPAPVIDEPVAPPSSAPVLELVRSQPPAAVAEDKPTAPEPEQPIPLSHRAPSLPECRLLSHREEEPTDAVPIAYREYAYAVSPSASEGELRNLLLSLWEQVRSNLSRRPPGKYVQIALFATSEPSPVGSPTALLSWKDWRGDPSIQIEVSNGRAMAYAAEANTAVPPEVAERAAAPRLELGPSPSSAPVSFVPQPVREPAPQVTSEPAPQAQGAFPPPAAAFPQPAAVPTDPPASNGPLVSAEEPSAEEAAAIAAEAAALASAYPAPAQETLAPQSGPMVVAEETDAEEAARIAAEADLLRTVPPPEEPPAPVPSTRAGSSFAVAARLTAKQPAERKRRRPDEDLIGELFEHMHALHFMPDLVTGAEYVLSTVWSVLPCEGALIHVFDINTAEFVVVRADGPNPDSVLLLRTSDREPLFREALRRTRTIAVENAAGDPRYAAERFERLGISVQRALCGPVQNAGRYLGIVELMNPITDAPFHEGEINALDYVCDQFAEFIADRPVVLEADVVLRS